MFNGTDKSISMLFAILNEGWLFRVSLFTVMP